MLPFYVYLIKQDILALSPLLRNNANHSNEAQYLMHVVEVLTYFVETVHLRKTKSCDSSSGTSGKMDTCKIINL